MLVPQVAANNPIIRYRNSITMEEQFQFWMSFACCSLDCSTLIPPLLRKQITIKLLISHTMQPPPKIMAQ